MNKWLTRIGVTLLVIAALLISPLADYLPVDWWYKLISSIGTIFDNEAKHVYYKVVPGSGASNYIHIYVLAAIGVTMVVLGKYVKLKQ